MSHVRNIRLIYGRTSGGDDKPVRVDTDGIVQTSGSGGGGGDASAANQTLEIAAVNKLNAQLLDLDTGAGTALTAGFFLAVPALGGPVAGGTDTNPIAVRGQAAATETLANVSSSATNVTLVAANAARRSVIIFNDSTQALYVKFGATASATSFTYKVFPSQTLEFPLPMYVGIVDGIWDSAQGSARVTEAA